MPTSPHVCRRGALVMWANADRSAVRLRSFARPSRVDPPLRAEGSATDCRSHDGLCIEDQRVPENLKPKHQNGCPKRNQERQKPGTLEGVCRTYGAVCALHAVRHALHATESGGVRGHEKQNQETRTTTKRGDPRDEILHQLAMARTFSSADSSGDPLWLRLVYIACAPCWRGEVSGHTFEAGSLRSLISRL